MRTQLVEQTCYNLFADLQELARFYACNRLCKELVVIYQTRATVFHRDVQTPKRELKTPRACSGVVCSDDKIFIFDEIRCVWIADETLSLVFDISSQTKQKLRSKRWNKIVKIYGNKQAIEIGFLQKVREASNIDFVHEKRHMDVWRWGELALVMFLGGKSWKISKVCWKFLIFWNHLFKLYKIQHFSKRIYICICIPVCSLLVPKCTFKLLFTSLSPNFTPTFCDLSVETT